MPANPDSKLEIPAFGRTPDCGAAMSATFIRAGRARRLASIMPNI